MRHSRELVRRTAHDRLEPSCQRTFWVLPSNPKRTVPPGHPGAIEITCGKCKRCLITKRNLHVGRMLAEQVGAKASAMLTLTFDPEKVELPRVPSDEEFGPVVPDWFRLPSGKRYWKQRWKAYWDEARKYWVPFRKSLRKRYGQVQYCGAGELGSKRARLHFHTGIYFDEANKIPEWVNLPGRVQIDHGRARKAGRIDADGCFTSCGVKVKAQWSVKERRDEFICWLPEWPHGYVHIGELNGKSAGYIAKYIMKPADAAVLRGENSPHNSYATKVFRSHKLGYRFMRELGERCAREGIAPRTRFTLPDQVVAYGQGAGRHRQYSMTRGMKRELGQAHMRCIASMMARGELRRWFAGVEPGEGFIVGDLLEADVKRDPRVTLEAFFNKLRKEKRGQWSLPYLDLGGVEKAVSTPDGGVVVKTTRAEYVFCWPDLSGHGRDLRIPILGRDELVRAVRRGGVDAFGLHPPDVRLQVVEGVRRKRRRRQVLSADGHTCVWPLRQVLEHGGEGVASDDATRAAHVAAFGRWPSVKAVRAWASDKQVEGLRRRIVAVMQARWSPPAVVLGRRRQGVGLPYSWRGVALTPEDAERYPLFARWVREAEPYGPPF